MPATVEGPIPGLKEPQTAWLCIREPRQCRYISNSIKNIKNHWQQAHRWTAFRHGGRPPGQHAAQGEQEIQQSMAQVICLRMFVQGCGSHYIPVQIPAHSRGGGTDRAPEQTPATGDGPAVG